MADEASRPRLGRGLAALIGDIGDDEQAFERPRGGQRRVPVEFLAAELPQSAQVFRRGRSRRPRQFGSREGHRPADPGALGPERIQRLRDHRRRTPLARGPGGGAARRADRRAARSRTARRSNSRSSRTCSAPISTPWKRPRATSRWSRTYNYTQADLSKIIGKSRSHIANTMRLLKLPEDVRQAVHEGKLTAGHARALLSVDNPSAAARRIIDQGLTVRDAEAIGQADRAASGKPPRARVEKDADTRALEKAVGDALGLVVSIDHKSPGGQISIRYRNVEQLEDVCRRLKV